MPRPSNLRNKYNELLIKTRKICVFGTSVLILGKATDQLDTEKKRCRRFNARFDQDTLDLYHLNSLNV